MCFEIPGGISPSGVSPAPLLGVPCSAQSVWRDAERTGYCSAHGDERPAGTLPGTALEALVAIETQVHVSDAL